MRFLKPVNVLAAANMLCFAYAISGLFAFILFIFKGGDRVVLPMGLWLPEFHLTVDFKLFRANNLIFPIWGIPLCILCGLVTGWITCPCLQPHCKILGGREYQTIAWT